MLFLFDSKVVTMPETPMLRLSLEWCLLTVKKIHSNATLTLSVQVKNTHGGFCYNCSFLSLQPEEYGQEAMEGQGEAMLDPEGETYDETQQVISLQETKQMHLSDLSVNSFLCVVVSRL